ncbi:MAG TPA: translation initiation factor IF-2 N-terminal domain-containing protein, partial [Thermoanaerobaculia bacterium]
MGKLRVQDLAKMMGISNQDLVFKLKSIGVRVEGDDAYIDTDIIQAILQGKKLPHPREVILRDEQTPPEVVRRRTAATPASVVRRPANPLRPNRPRTLIQKVEPRIQTLPVSERPVMAAAPPPSVMAEAVAPQPVEPPRAEAAASVGAALPVEAPSVRTAEMPARREAVAPASRPVVPSRP